MNNTKMILDFESQKENQTEDELLVSDQIEVESDDQDEVEIALEDEACFLASHYHASIDAIPVLSYKDEVKYAVMVQAGQSLSKDDNSLQSLEIRRKAGIARQVLIEHNLRLVRSIARKTEGQGDLLDDLIQEGTIGLMEAIDKYDPNYGYRFSTYAYQTIQLKIKRCIQDQAKDIRIPNNLQDKIAKVKSVQSFLLQQLEREPSDLEISIGIAIGKDQTIEVLNVGKPLSDLAEILDLGDFSPEAVRDLLGITKPILRMDLPISEEDDRQWIDTISVTEKESLRPMDLESLRTILRSLLTVLDDRQATVIAYRYGLDGRDKVTYEELGKRIGFTRERARQIEKEALETLRSCKDSSQLLAFIG